MPCERFPKAGKVPEQVVQSKPVEQPMVVLLPDHAAVTTFESCSVIRHIDSSSCYKSWARQSRLQLQKGSVSVGTNIHHLPFDVTLGKYVRGLLVARRNHSSRFLIFPFTVQEEGLEIKLQDQRPGHD